MDLQVIQNKIFEVRGCRVMLDFHLAELYQVETRTLKQAVKRNIGRFPSDFMFVLSKEEANLLLSIEADPKVKFYKGELTNSNLIVLILLLRALSYHQKRSLIRLFYT